MRKILAASLLILTILWLRHVFFRPHTHLPGSHFNTDQNAAWLGVEWCMAPQEEERVAALADSLADHQIRYIFVYTSYLKADGTFNPTYDHAARFVEQMKRLAPDVAVLAWIGLPLRSSSPAWPDNSVDLADPTTRAQIAAFSRQLAGEIGFAGVHLDAEPLSSGDEAFLQLLAEVRAALGPGPLLSIAAPDCALGPPLPWGMWRPADYHAVATHADQIAVMSYDSALPSAWLYRQWMRWQVIRVTRAVAGHDIQLFFGLPASEEATFSHRPSAESLEAGLLGLLDGLNDAASRPAAVTGLALYPWWEVDSGEWAAFDELWLGK